MKIHPLALVSPEAAIGLDVVIGPFCVIEPGACVGDGCRLESHVVVKAGTTLGRGNHVFEGTVLGGLPQHIRRGERPGVLSIGSRNTIRENVTIHRALHAGQATTVGDGNLIMAGAHVAHDCRLGSHIIMANNVMLAGHVEVQDRTYLSGAVGIHQFCRVGGYAMLGGQARVVKDVPPYVTIDGASGFVVGLNLVGLRRAGFSSQEIVELKDAYRLIYRSGLSWAEVQERLPAAFPAGPAARFHEFFAGGRRGFVPERRIPPGSTIKLIDLDAAPPPAEFRAKAG